MRSKSIYRGYSLRKALGIIILAILLLASGASAQTNISSCTTISEPGEYILNKSITDSEVPCILITSSDVIFNGDGHEIDGIDASNIYYLGVHVYNSTMTLTNITIKNLIVTDWYDGIYYHNAMNGGLINNTVSSNLDIGIWIDSSNSTKLSNNIASDNLFGSGIRLTSSSGNTIDWNNVSNNHNSAGIGVGEGSNNNMLNNNTVISNSLGIAIGYSYNNTISNNIVLSNGEGIVLGSSNNNVLKSNDVLNSNDGIRLTESNNNILSDNNASNNYYGIELDFSNNNTLSSNNANSNRFDGIHIFYSNNNTINNTNAFSNINGIYLSISNDNKLNGNNVLNNYNGIWLESSSNSIVNSTNASNNNYYGIYLSSYSNTNALNGNRLLNNHYGIYLNYNCNYNTLNDNNVSNNSYGIYIDSSNSNAIYNNYFNNANNAFDNGNNIWHITKTAGTNIIGGAWLGGNYWSDYAGSDLDGDGLGDTLVPYNSAGNIINGGDYLPLVYPGTGENQPPVADFVYSPLNPIIDQTITFDASPSYDPDGNITSYSWNINGNMFTTKIVTISFSIAGYYYAELMVTDNNGTTSSTAKWIYVAAPPLTINLSIDPEGSVNRLTGDAMIHGTLTCSRPVSVSMSGNLSQRAGRFNVFRGSFGFQFWCDSNSTTWNATVRGVNGPFNPGLASADAFVSAYDWWTGDYAADDASAVVHLRGKER